MNKIIIITGLTASGKSKLALELAQKYNGEIISADSVQVYRGLNIGSAKETADTLKLVKHHLIDIKNPDENYNVGNFLFDCNNAIIDIISRGKLPIIVGGTAMYVKALISGFTLGEVKADEQIRQKYQDLAKLNGNDYVWNELNNINPKLAQAVHPNNLKRVIRYLEISLGNNNLTKQQSIVANYQTLAVGIVADRGIIYEKINRRVDQMIAEGLQDEVAGLISHGANENWQSMNSIGYKEWFDFFAGSANLDATINLIKQHTRNYCKRQLTFLKTMPEIELMEYEECKKRVEEFLND